MSNLSGRDSEAEFFINREILSLDQYKQLNNNRENLDLQLLIGLATDDELFEQIKTEIDLFEKCYSIIEREDADNHKKLLLLVLFDRINTLFAHLFHLFPINAKHAEKYLQLCSNYICSIISSLPTILRENNLIK
ncbi:uncharacterized protein LOC114127014 [Aphis gossypii]|uniref:Uncharacterized protein n=1 Tax=Aphis gossypii TaxID=80765 RepID=A0A9P0J9K4_APHGO|nr:uncharacterized protein LOC114127014 [Aphis gossypii]CAH1732946.1 unnamed protein product [Aphis gossypii]